MQRETADFTAVVREDNEVHILKAKIVDEKNLYFQMHNRTRNVTTPCFQIPANFGGAKWVKEDKITRAIDEHISLTRNLNRVRLVQYYNVFKLQYLIGAWHDK